MVEKLVAKYRDDVDIRRLKLVGNISRKVIDAFFLPHNPYTYTYRPAGEGRVGQVSFLVSDEANCVRLVEELKPKLAIFGYELEYEAK